MTSTLPLPKLLMPVRRPLIVLFTVAKVAKFSIQQQYGSYNSSNLYVFSFQPCDCWTCTFILIVTPFNTNTCCVMAKCVTCCSSVPTAAAAAIHYSKKCFSHPTFRVLRRPSSFWHLVVSSAKNYTVAHNR